ncbi:PepSY domain-containing protein [Paenibacillus polymyxa]|uniref:PepSY domain-containing protein n=1 Tax=Paenibacillus polymyxa TaxID=1406 RepID=UPI001E644E38|nr:PepSY domain-containing protein [Paenibacillus polymyxa]
MKTIYTWMIGGMVAAILITICLLQWPWARSLAASPLEEKTVVQSVLHQYPGEVLESQRLDNFYVIKLERTKGKYVIKVNAYDGVIQSIKRTQMYTDAKQEPQDPPPVPHNPVTNQIQSINLTRFLLSLQRMKQPSLLQKQ